MQVQAYNQYSTRKYHEFRAALGQVFVMLEEVEELLKKVNPDRQIMAAGYTLIGRDELVGELRRAYDQWAVLQASSKNWEKELLSKTWRL